MGRRGRSTPHRINRFRPSDYADFSGCGANRRNRGSKQKPADYWEVFRRARQKIMVYGNSWTIKKNPWLYSAYQSAVSYKTKQEVHDNVVRTRAHFPHVSDRRIGGKRIESAVE